MEFNGYIMNNKILPIYQSFRSSKNISTHYSVPASVDIVYATGNTDVTLPLATVKKTELIIVNKGQGVVTIKRSGSDLIGSDTTLSLIAQWQKVNLISDNTNKWYVTSSTDTTVVIIPTFTWYKVGMKEGLNLEYKDYTSFSVTAGIMHINNGITDKICELADRIDYTVAGLQASKQYGVYANFPDVTTLDASSISTIDTSVMEPIFFEDRLGWYPSTPIGPTGGSMYRSGNKTVHIFPQDDTFKVPVGKNGVIEVLVIAGGGGGASTGSGGGAGGYVYDQSHNVIGGQVYTVKIGAGGNGGAGGTGNSGTKGSDSTFNTIIAEGGGSGTSHGYGAGGNGGSGGGGAVTTGGNAPPGGTGSQGYAGGAGSVDAGQNKNCGGGGGAGGVGQAGGSSAPSGNGGIGLLNSITGVPIQYAGGGGSGEVNGNVAGVGGTGGGGNGNVGAAGNLGLPNSGGGGGGGGFTSGTYYAGGKGGSGIVIIRYNTADFSVVPSADATKRCIGFIYTDTSSRIAKFSVNKGMYRLSEYAQLKTWTGSGDTNFSLDLTACVPIGGLLCLLTHWGARYSTTDGGGYIRTYGDPYIEPPMIYMGQNDGGQVRTRGTLQLKCSSNKKFTMNTSLGSRSDNALTQEAFILPDYI